jgi:hypothetical protein
VGLIPGSITAKIVEKKMSILFENGNKNASHMLWQTNQKGQSTITNQSNSETRQT